MLIDTHGHVNFNAFKDDSSEVLKRTLESDIQVVMPGSQYSTSKRAVEMAQKYERGVYAAVGLHPVHLGERRKVDALETQSEHSETSTERPWESFGTRQEEFDYDEYKKLALSEAARGRPSRRVVAIGEVGLDYYYFPKNKAKRELIKQKQKDTLQKQMDLADELGLSTILHCRVAHEDLLEFLGGRKKVRGVVHSYTGTVEQAEKFMEFGLYIGFNGLIFKNVPALPNPEEIISRIPLERIVLETDSPYLIPPQAAQERNEPIFVKYVGQEIARIKNVSFDVVARATTQNAKTLFALK